MRWTKTIVSWGQVSVVVALAACGGSSKTTDGGGPIVDVGPPPSMDPVEPIWDPTKVAARVKSPSQRMHFTEGLPFRILADGNDPNAYECPPGHPPYVCPDSNMQFFVDGVMVGMVPPDPDDMNLWELRMPNGLTPGDHVVTVKFKPHNKDAVDGVVPIYIYVDPMPAKPNTVELTSDLVLSGSTNLDWTNALVKGNGHTVRAGSGYSGKVIIKDSLVTGLAGFDSKIGIDVTTTGGVDIQGSIFEATAPLHLVVNGSAPVTLINNEFRSSNYVTFVSSDPTKSPVLDIAGNTSGAKVMQGNNVGAGIVLITGMANWQIGGLHDREGNIFIGPRCVLQLDGSQNATIQGNYLHHDYYGGFSQGYNLDFGNGSNGAVAEHNVIRDGSWPLQSFGGEFRYNLMINSGHDFVRSSQAATKFHHNIFAHAQGIGSSYDGAFFVYGSESGMTFDNNTVDVGGDIGIYDAPAIVLASSNTTLASLRNNAFTQFSPMANRWPTKALVSGGDGESSVGNRITKADYNAWFNPLNDASPHYQSGIASSPGGHDVAGDPLFNGNVPERPYQIDEGSVWLRTYGVSQVLAYYRALYTPRSGSPLIDAGDTADGSGNDIGAIGAGTQNAADKFGLVMDAN